MLLAGLKALISPFFIFLLGLDDFKVGLNRVAYHFECGYSQRWCAKVAVFSIVNGTNEGNYFYTEFCKERTDYFPAVDSFSDIFPTDEMVEQGTYELETYVRHNCTRFGSWRCLKFAPKQYFTNRDNIIRVFATLTDSGIYKCPE